MDASKIPEGYRYSMIYAHTKTEGKAIKIDHYTGETWTLVANVWVPIVQPKKK